jgi:hypothetical protein
MSLSVYEGFWSKVMDSESRVLVNAKSRLRWDKLFIRFIYLD